MAESTQNDEDRWSASLPAAAPAEAPGAAVAAPKDSPLFADTARVSVPNVPRKESAELGERTTDIGLGDPAGGSTKPFATYNPRNPGNTTSLLPPVAATRDLPRPSSSSTRNPPSRPPVAPAAGIPGEHSLRVAPPARPVPGTGPSNVATLPPGKPVVSRPPPPPPTASKPPPPPPTAVKAEAFFGRASGEFGNAGGEHTPVIDGRLAKLPPPPFEAVPARAAAPSEPETEVTPATADIASLFGEELPPDPPPGEGLMETSGELKITDDAEVVNTSGEEGSASIQVDLDAPGPDALPPTPLVTAETDDPPVADSASDDGAPAVDPDPTAPITVAPPLPVRPLSSYLPAFGLVAAMLAMAFGAASVVSRWMPLPSTRRPTTTMVVRPAPQRQAPQPPTATCLWHGRFLQLPAAEQAVFYGCRRPATERASDNEPLFHCRSDTAPPNTAARNTFCTHMRRLCRSPANRTVTLEERHACMADPVHHALNE